MCFIAPIDRPRSAKWLITISATLVLPDFLLPIMAIFFVVHHLLRARVGLVGEVMPLLDLRSPLNDPSTSRALKFVLFSAVEAIVWGAISMSFHPIRLSPYLSNGASNDLIRPTIPRAHGLVNHPDLIDSIITNF
jgi:hypothetical protein